MESRAHAVGTFAEAGDLRSSCVVLIGDLPNDFLEDVLDRHEPRRAAVLIDDDGEVDPSGLHLA